MVITGKEKIKFFRLLTLRAALKLEILGMKRRGRSVSALLKEEFNLSGSRSNVLKGLELIILIQEKEVKKL